MWENQSDRNPHIYMNICNIDTKSLIEFLINVIVKTILHQDHKQNNLTYHKNTRKKNHICVKITYLNNKKKLCMYFEWKMTKATYFYWMENNKKKKNKGRSRQRLFLFLNLCAYKKINISKSLFSIYNSNLAKRNLLNSTPAIREIGFLTYVATPQSYNWTFFLKTIRVKGFI
jgi:hypothetical protein